MTHLPLTAHTTTSFEPAVAEPVTPSASVSLRLGSRLRELRRQSNLTQDQFAVQIGVDRSHLSNIERGQSSPSLVFLNLVAAGFGMSLSQFLMGV